MIRQLSVFLENRPGRAAEMARLLGAAGHNMRALVLADTAEYGVARILCDRPLAAREALAEAGFGVSVTEVVAVAVPDDPGALADLLDLFGRERLNVEYAYVFVRPGGTEAVDILRLDDTGRAQRVLTDAGYRLVTAAEIFEPDPE
jgi:hypothetical protein